MKHTILWILIVAISINYSFSQEKAIEKIDSLLNYYCDSAILPHANILICKGGDVIMEDSYGFKNINTREKLQTDDIFRISSLTKLITAVAVMQLVDRELISLDDPVSKYIPEFSNLQVLDSLNNNNLEYTAHKIDQSLTIRHLLAQTSGIAYGPAMYPKIGLLYNQVGIDMGYDTSNTLLKTKITKIPELPLLHEPGAQWTYGFNYDVLGFLIEKVSKLSLEEYFQNNIFDPLDMNKTYFYLNQKEAEELVPIHLYDKNQKRYYVADKQPDLPYHMPLNYPVEGSKTYLSGGVGLSCSIRDFAKVVLMLKNNGVYTNKTILSEHAVQQITVNQIGDLPFLAKGMTWGYGTIVLKDEKEYLGEGGGFAYYKVNVDKDYIILFFTQTTMSPYSTFKMFLELDSFVQAEN